jgi:hypothetical protein
MLTAITSGDPPRVRGGLMRGSRPVAVALAATFLVASLVLVAPDAGAGSASPWVGTYAGSGKGKAVKGTKEVEATVTVWLEDAGGGNAKVTVRVDKYGLVMGAVGTVEPQANGSYLIPIDVSSSTVSANAVLTVVHQGDRMVMSGQGAGIALGNEGTGTLGAEQTATGVVLPSLGAQTTDMLKDVGGGPARAESVQTPAATGAVIDVKPTSSLAPARPSAPLATEREIFAMVLLFLIFMYLVLVPVWGGRLTELKSSELSVAASEAWHGDSTAGGES